MATGVLRRLHNPRNKVCGCDETCWCKATAVGRLVRWWLPSRRFGIHHGNAALEQWKRENPGVDPGEWKRQREAGGSNGWHESRPFTHRPNPEAPRLERRGRREWYIGSTHDGRRVEARMSVTMMFEMRGV
jgi:hypothetical protein